MRNALVAAIMLALAGCQAGSPVLAYSECAPIAEVRQRVLADIEASHGAIITLKGRQAIAYLKAAGVASPAVYGAVLIYTTADVTTVGFATPDMSQACMGASISTATHLRAMAAVRMASA